MTPREAVETLRRFEAPAVLAQPELHQGTSRACCRSSRRPASLAWRSITRTTTRPQIEQLAATAKRHGLMPLGGSDYHALKGPGEREPGDIPLPDRIALDFIEKELSWLPTGTLS